MEINLKIETEIAKAVSQWLIEQHWEVYPEVRPDSVGPRHDIVAIRNKIAWIIECKTSFGLAVIEQALHAKMRAHFASVAVPGGVNRKNYAFQRRICRDYGIGVITVSQFATIRQIVAPVLNRTAYRMANRLINCCTENHKTMGVAGGKSAFYTPYKRTINSVRKIIRRFGECDIKTIMKELKEHHYSNDKTATACILQSLGKYENWCGFKRDEKRIIVFEKDEFKNENLLNLI